MPELERALVELGRAVELPPAPDLAAAVRARIAETPQRRFGRRELAIGLAVFVALAAAVLAVPPARTAIFDWLGIKGVAITSVEKLPSTPVARDLSLGEKVTIAEVRRRAPWLVLPGDTPDAVYFNRDIPGGQVALLWGSPTNVRLLMTEFRGELIAEKVLGSGTSAESTDVAGADGVWIHGAPHFFVYRDYDGETREQTLRLVRNALLWQRGDLTLRLEGGLSKEEALRIARSAR